MSGFWWCKVKGLLFSALLLSACHPVLASNKLVVKMECNSQTAVLRVDDQYTILSFGDSGLMTNFDPNSSRSVSYNKQEDLTIHNITMGPMSVDVAYHNSKHDYALLTLNGKSLGVCKVKSFSYK